MITDSEINDWIEKHNAQHWQPCEIVEAIATEIINNTCWADDEYPGIKERLLTEVHECTKQIMV